MSIEQILIKGKWRDAQNPSGTFHAFNPVNKSKLPGQIPISGEKDIEELLLAGLRAAITLQSVPPGRIGDGQE